MSDNKNNKKIFVAVPAFGLMMGSHTGMSLFRLAQHLQAIGIPAAASTVSFPDIVDVRNIFLTLWYDNTDASHLLFIDADMDFDSRLVIDMLAFDKPLVGAIYPARTLPIKYVGKAGEPGPAETVVDGFMRVDGVGCGIMLVSRECITEMLRIGAVRADSRGIGKHTAATLLETMGLKRIIRAFDQIEVDGTKMAEDLSFCQRWLKIGGEVWANVNYEIGHTGPHRFYGRYLDMFSEITPITAETV